MEVIKWLSVTERHTKMYLDRQLEPLGLNSSQHMYITRVCENPGMTQDRFITSFYIDPSNITRSLAYLEREGFIRKENNKKDKRTCYLYPTQKGEMVYHEIVKICRQWEQDILGILTQEEQQTLDTLLQRIGKQSVDYLEEYGQEE